MDIKLNIDVWDRDAEEWYSADSWTVDDPGKVEDWHAWITEQIKTEEVDLVVGCSYLCSALEGTHVVATQRFIWR